MPRSLALAVVASVLALLGGCAKHPSADVGTTYISSGTPDVRGDDASAADELTAAICRRESRCVHRGTKAAAETPAPGGAACVAQVHPAATQTLQALECTPAEARAGMKDCLAALASDDCSSTLSSGPPVVPACRTTSICASGGARPAR